MNPLPVLVLSALLASGADPVPDEELDAPLAEAPAVQEKPEGRVAEYTAVVAAAAAPLALCIPPFTVCCVGTGILSVGALPLPLQISISRWATSMGLIGSYQCGVFVVGAGAMWAIPAAALAGVATALAIPGAGLVASLVKERKTRVGALVAAVAGALAASGATVLSIIAAVLSFVGAYCSFAVLAALGFGPTPTEIYQAAVGVMLVGAFILTALMGMGALGPVLLGSGAYALVRLTWQWEPRE